MAKVCLDSKWGLVDKNGKEIVPCVYDTLFNSDGERAFFSRKTENDYIYGYVYMNGREDIC